MVLNIQKIFDRLSNELIELTESTQPVFYFSNQESSSSESLVTVDESSNSGNNHMLRRYVGLRKLRKKTVPLYIWCLQKNMNNNHPH